MSTINEIYIGGKRYYWIDGSIYPSVTTVTEIVNKKGIDVWKSKVGESVANYIKLQATDIGTEYHSMIHKYLTNGNKIDTTVNNLYAEAHFLNI